MLSLVWTFFPDRLYLHVLVRDRFVAAVDPRYCTAAVLCNGIYDEAMFVRVSASLAEYRLPVRVSCNEEVFRVKY